MLEVDTSVIMSMPAFEMSSHSTPVSMVQRSALARRIVRALPFLRCLPEPDARQSSDIVIYCRTYRHTDIDAFGGSSRQTRTQRAMVMLIESGVLYMLFILVQVIMSLSSVNASLRESTSLASAFSTYQYVSSSIAGIYPTLVVILVNSKHSMLRSGAGTGSSNSALVYKRGQGASEATYSSAATVDPVRGPAGEIILYGMAQLKEDCAEDPEAMAGVTRKNETAKIEQSVAYDV
ncbi:uncharacterized protein B0H18DRAFT_952096 [Fomitopsis serialis]|uniref:uncharacterized protein n=1 Tax=Fomitopsis serialis TaxID=139415 RepID=UPI00200833B4|nr:uncharacterized protein B0H18DRAFT_952095 [Neoantrodia serialis]XP_047897568.1 uncharacterized protein B0H18DRAFT_952096 [Neoantrodia serialis]KAH9932932.1 hypothetical protein B0H18DRAFT_952095 [Neoantrodia serialis]KAH9932933.1 hypothetical protein B0H18DRAFT_952096 [Neoantrodia serialis]